MKHILSTHLGKLVSTGEILTNSDGCYSFPQDMKTPQLLLEHSCLGVDVTDLYGDSLAIIVRDDVETHKPVCKKKKNYKIEEVEEKNCEHEEEKEPRESRKTEEMVGKGHKRRRMWLRG